MQVINNFECANCGDGINTRVEIRQESYPVKGQDISILATVRVCSQCNEPVYDRELDSKNLEMAFDVYRREHHLIGPIEIKTLRESYSLSQRSLAALLGWGEVTIHRYEQGCLPDEAHNNLLHLIKDPFNMQTLAKENIHRLSTPAQHKLLESIEILISQQGPEKIIHILEQAIIHKGPSIYTGFRAFDVGNLMQMIIFCGRETKGVLKTKLNKLLWYADFEHYRRHSVSISGSCYLHYPYGPVPENYETYLGILIDRGFVEQREEEYGEYKGTLILATMECFPIYLSDTAQEVLQEVIECFKDKGSRDISNISHEEEGYKKTKDRDPIPYEYAESLKIKFKHTNTSEVHS